MGSLAQLLEHNGKNVRVMAFETRIKHRVIPATRPGYVLLYNEVLLIW